MATRTRDLLRYREGMLPAGTQLAGKRVAAAFDGGRVRIRTTIKKTRVGKTRKRKKFRTEWREPKVLVLFELDAKGRMKRGCPSVIDGTLRGPDALIELVAFHLHRLGAAQAKEIVFLGDGAPWIWNRLDWIVEKVGLDPQRVFHVLDWCHAVHHISLALEDLSLGKTERQQRYQALRKLLKQGRADEVIDELKLLAKSRLADSVAWREIRYLQKHAEAGRLRYAVFRYRHLPIGSGAIESTIRRVINLRLKGNSIYWVEENAEAIFQLRAALLSGRWDEVINHTRDSVARDRRKDWHWIPPEALAELKAIESDDLYDTEPTGVKALAAQAA